MRGPAKADVGNRDQQFPIVCIASPNHKGGNGRATFGAGQLGFSVRSAAGATRMSDLRAESVKI